LAHRLEERADRAARGVRAERHGREDAVLVRSETGARRRVETLAPVLLGDDRERPDGLARQPFLDDAEGAPVEDAHAAAVRPGPEEPPSADLLRLEESVDAIARE